MTRRVSPVEISFAWQEFKDAIESLSPEQKRFATAVRSMQLESSVFGVCVVQLKPQLEALLGLDDDALTKGSSSHKICCPSSSTIRFHLTF